MDYTEADCFADDDVAAHCDKLWREEIIPVLVQPVGEDLIACCAALLELWARYRDTSIWHRTWQIAMDGSQKLPPRILGTISDNLALGRVPKRLCLAVAGWMRYVSGVDETGTAIDVRGPLAADLKNAFDEADDKAAALLRFDNIFGSDVPRDETFRGALGEAYDTLTARGTLVAPLWHPGAPEPR